MRTPVSRAGVAGEVGSGRAIEAESSLARMLGLLDVFTPAAPSWSADALVRYAGVSRSTAYRYIKALSAAGLLNAVAEGHYILGPRITELDRQIRQCDPLYNAAGAAMKRLVVETGHAALLCTLFRDATMCIREELAPDSPPHLFTRGQRRPLFLGAASKIMLPYLPAHQLRGLYSRNETAIAMAGLGADWAAFRATMARIRQAGFVVTSGEFNPGVVGVSAPLFNRSRHILGSVGIAGAKDRLGRVAVADAAGRVRAAAEEITRIVSGLGTVLDRPPRAVGSGALEQVP
ncbi:MAG: IclR family transcriptional regulator [Acetobacteraceae bacterium]